jgi:hypothetical protein
MNLSLSTKAKEAIKTSKELLPESIQQEMLQRTKYWKKILE